jgi:flagellar hook-basal body complex protein FliE
MAISPIGGGSSAITPIEFPTLDKTTTPSTGGTQGANFGDKLSGALESLQESQSTSDDLSMQVATGKLTNIHDYMIAANQAELATQLTVAVKNKAVDAFNQVMNMSV